MSSDTHPTPLASDPFVVADLAVAAQRAFTAALRAGRSAGLHQPAAIRAANAYVKRTLGLDWVDELGIAPLLDELDGGSAAADGTSVGVFLAALLAGDLAPLQAAPGLTSAWHAAYAAWCQRTGGEAVSVKRFVLELESRHALRRQRKRYASSTGEVVMSSVLYFAATPPRGLSEVEWLGQQIRTSALMFDAAGQVH